MRRAKTKEITDSFAPERIAIEMHMEMMQIKQRKQRKQSETQY